MQGTQLVRTFSLPCHPSKHCDRKTHKRNDREKKEEDVTHCPICTLMGCECKGKLIPSEWDDDNSKEDQKEDPKVAAVMPVAPHSTINHINHHTLVEFEQTTL